MISLIKRIGISGSTALALIFVSLAGSSQLSLAQNQSTAAWEQGRNYQLMSGAETKGPAATVQVTEVFGYFCPHCFHLEPQINAWLKQGKPAYVKFNTVPVIWPGNDATAQLARLYYTVVAMHRDGDLHEAIFKEIHIEHHALMDADATKAEALQSQFLQQHGVSAADFARTYHSPEVNAQVAKAQEFSLRDRVMSVPTIIVADKYTTDVQMTGGEAQLFDLTNELAAREHTK
jgi:protein dithiol oxidoreductase (disulfide-forming)